MRSQYHEFLTEYWGMLVGEVYCEIYGVCYNISTKQI